MKSLSAFLLPVELILAAGNGISDDPTEEWVARYNGPVNGVDGVRAGTVDVDGNVYVTGQSDSVHHQNDFATVKYDCDGVEQWVSRYNGPGNS